MIFDNIFIETAYHSGITYMRATLSNPSKAPSWIKFILFWLSILFKKQFEIDERDIALRTTKEGSKQKKHKF